ncbi:MAG TPA: ABC transporter ATP-binding protein [Candidatus Magasanikbacteria bacterium]|nr:ABC transporter ATP-binding protein [Candidatus Magasanikbacteria bacterium]
MTNHILQIDQVSVNYGGVKALDRATLNLYEGEIITLIGPNGAGKSTILKAFFGLTKIASGQIIWCDEPMTPTPIEMSNRGIVYVPQGRRVFDSLTVKENIEISVLHNTSKKEIQKRLFEIYQMFPLLQNKQHSLAGRLSGGEQQMVAMARALITRPKVLLLDEPSLGLAPKVMKEIFEKIKEVNSKLNISIILVEHNFKSALSITDRIYILDKGRIISDVYKNEISNALLEKIFLGK